MDKYPREKYERIDTKSDSLRLKAEKRPAVPFVSENVNPAKRMKKGDEKPVSYIHQSKWISDRYENLLLIGKGSFGRVYRAKPKDGSRKYVAIKEILMQTSSRQDDRQHAISEIDLVQKLGGKHNILPTMGVHRDMGAYVVMEYFPHEEFRDIVKNMDATEISHYMKNLISSLNYLHSNNIIHRDVKPDNFLYNRKHRRYALIDFGLSQYYNNYGDRSAELKKKFGASNRRSTLNMPCLCEGKLIPPCSICQMKASFIVNKAGTPRFLAPEVLIGSTKQTTKIDLWAAGMMLFYLIIQKYPFFGARDNISMIAELSTIFGTQPFVNTAKEQEVDLSLNAFFRPLNIIHYAFSRRYESTQVMLAMPMKCNYCTNYFHSNEAGCLCCPLDVNESSQCLSLESDKELAAMLFYCLQVNPIDRISSKEFVDKFNGNQIGINC